MQVFVPIGFPHDLLAHYLRFGSAPVIQCISLASASILPDLIGTAPDLFFDSVGRVACCLGDRLQARARRKSAPLIEMSRSRSSFFGTYLRCLPPHRRIAALLSVEVQPRFYSIPARSWRYPRRVSLCSSQLTVRRDYSTSRFLVLL